MSQEEVKPLGELVALIQNWAWDRNLIDGSTPNAQMLKLMEEVGELVGGVCKDKGDVIKDSIGDVFVVLTIVAAQMGWSIEECVQAAYAEIKDRKGRMVQGVFVKEEA